MPENPNKIWIQQLKHKVKTFFVSKNVLTFSLFLLLSTLFWFMNALSIVRETRIDIPITYINLPNTIGVSRPLPEKINVKISDEGKNLFAYNRKKITPATIDLNYDYLPEGEFRISQEKIRQELSNSLRTTTNLLSFSPDTIVVNYMRLIEKRLPIRFCGVINTATQYYLSEPIQLFPDSVTVFCSEKEAAHLTEIQTEYVELNQVKDSVSMKLNLQKLAAVQYSTSYTQLETKAEMFTEKSLDLPIKTLHVPKGFRIRTFPAYATVHFNVGLSYFNTINEEDISIIFDYTECESEASQNKRQLKAIYNVPYIFNLRIKPHEVEFILESM